MRYTLSTESTFVISNADSTSPSASFRLRLIHLTVGPFPFCLFCLWNNAGDTCTFSDEGARETNVWMIAEVVSTPFSLFLLLGWETYTFQTYVESISIQVDNIKSDVKGKEHWQEMMNWLYDTTWVEHSRIPIVGHLMSLSLVEAVHEHHHWHLLPAHWEHHPDFDRKQFVDDDPFASASAVAKEKNGMFGRTPPIRDDDRWVSRKFSIRLGEANTQTQGQNKLSKI